MVSGFYSHKKSYNIHSMLMQSYKHRKIQPNAIITWITSILFIYICHNWSVTIKASGEIELHKIHITY